MRARETPSASPRRDVTLRAVPTPLVLKQRWQSARGAIVRFTRGKVLYVKILFIVQKLQLWLCVESRLSTLTHCPVPEEIRRDATRCLCSASGVSNSLTFTICCYRILITQNPFKKVPYEKTTVLHIIPWYFWLVIFLNTNPGINLYLIVFLTVAVTWGFNMNNEIMVFTMFVSKICEFCHYFFMVHVFVLLM